MDLPIVVLGAGGHAKVVIDILEQAGGFDIRGCTCIEASSDSILGYPILGSDDILPSLLKAGVRHAFVAIGDNRIRLRTSLALTAMGFTLAKAISPRAAVSPHAIIGPGVVVMPGAVINADSAIASGAIINTGATVDHDCRVGECAHVAPGTNLAGNVTVGSGAILGVGSRVIPGVTVGEWAVVGAGAVVIRDVPPAVTVIGVPATQSAAG